MSDTLPEKNTVCVVIVSYNGASSISGTVNSLIDQVDHLVIVDNGSTCDTLEVLRAINSVKVAILYNDENTGVAHALNQGVRYALSNGFTWVLTMDQDSIAEHTMVSKLLECAARYPKSDKVVSLSPAIAYKLGALHGKERADEQRFTVITSGNLVHLSVFEIIGFYEEKLFIDSVDFDFCLRLLSAGYKIIRCHTTRLFHSLGDPVVHKIFVWNVTSWNHSSIRKYYVARNNIYILKKYLCAFPLFCLRKQLGMLELLFVTIFFESDRLLKLRYMAKGVAHGVWGKYGRLR